MKTRCRLFETSSPLLSAALLSACSNITGLDGSSHYACKAPEGVACDSVSGNYYNAIQNNLPSQRRSAANANPTGLPDSPGSTPHGVAARSNAPDASAPTAASTPVEGSVQPAAPLRSSPRVLRLWIKPWEDADRDLNGESLVYVQVDDGHWLIDHVQRQAREPYAPIRPTRPPVAPGKDSASQMHESGVGPMQQQSQSGENDEPGVAKTLRALQARPSATPRN